jgi:hypothetical protein
MKIKIVSGWSNPGGSTTANINLTNLLNNNGIDCTFYGSHKWHLEKCKGNTVSDLVVGEGDILISHFFKFPPNLKKIAKLKKHIYTCHEKDLQPLSTMDLSQYDLIHFINKTQKEWHSVSNPSVIIPNVYDPLVSGSKSESSKGVAGVIGSIDENKKPEVSIKRALGEGYHTVLLYGSIDFELPPEVGGRVDREHYTKVISKLPEIGKTVYIKGYENDKQKMYDSIEAVFLSSESEVDPFVRGECYLTGTKFYGNDQTNYGELPIYESKILEKWVEVFES